MTAAEALACIPAQIIVGINRYTVRVVDIVDLEDDECKAAIHPDLQTIEIGRDHVNAPQVVGSLLHEILHAIWDEKKLPNKPAEERAVIALEIGLVGLLQDNPKLLTWIKKGLKK